MTIGVERANWLARGWYSLAVIAAGAALALPADVHSNAALVVFCVCLMAAKMCGDHRWRRGWRVWYSIIAVSIFALMLAGDLPGYLMALVGVSAGTSVAAIERREEQRVESPFERQPT